MQNCVHLSPLYESGIDFFALRLIIPRKIILKIFGNFWSSFLDYHARAKCFCANQAEEKNRFSTHWIGTLPHTPPRPRIVVFHNIGEESIR